MANVTHIQDDAQQTRSSTTRWSRRRATTPMTPSYRLCRAKGEHIGQVSQPETTWNDDGRVRLPSPGDGQAMRRFAEQYGYDAAGNLPRARAHRRERPAGRRRFSYDEPSLIEPGTASNRLTSVVVGRGQPERFGYDAHGNVMAMAHLAGMEWDFRDQVAGGWTSVAAGRRTTSTTPPASGCARWSKNAGNLVEERITLAAFEVFRRRNAAGTVSLKQSLHVMDGGQRIALVDTRTLGIETGVPAQLVRFQLGNHLGSGRGWSWTAPARSSAMRSTTPTGRPRTRPDATRLR